MYSISSFGDYMSLLAIYFPSYLVTTDNFSTNH